MIGHRHSSSEQRWPVARRTHSTPKPHKGEGLGFARGTQSCSQALQSLPEPAVPREDLEGKSGTHWQRGLRAKRQLRVFIALAWSSAGTTEWRGWEGPLEVVQPSPPARPVPGGRGLVHL